MRRVRVLGPAVAMVAVMLLGSCADEASWSQWCAAVEDFDSAGSATPTEGARQVASAVEIMAEEAPPSVEEASTNIARQFAALEAAQGGDTDDAESEARRYFAGRSGDIDADLAKVRAVQAREC